MSVTDESLQDYYVQRVEYYDRVYTDPNRQDELRYWEQQVQKGFDQHDVLEIASGTGHWTRHLAQNAKAVTAIDNAGELVTLAKTRYHNRSDVRFLIEDAYDLPDHFERRFNGAFAGLWLSHVPISRLREFLQDLHRCLVPGSTVMFLDNTEEQCLDLPIAHRDREGNTYQRRTLDDGSSGLALKNFPSEAALQQMIKGLGKNGEYQALMHYWAFCYTTV